jgi:hypothetical protein
MKNLFFIVLSFASLALFSCGKTTEELTFDGPQFFPLKTGATYYYDYDSVWVDCPVGRRDTFRHEIKEVMESWFIDGEGDSALRVEVYRRNAGTTSWGAPIIYSMKVTSAFAIRTQENIRFVKLNFPLSPNARWNGNRFNHITDWGSDFRVTEWKTQWQEFPETVLITQKSQENLIEKKLFTERYASDVGLVERVAIDISGIVSDPLDPNDCAELLPPATPWNTVPILNRIRTGYVVQQVLVDFQP